MNDLFLLTPSQFGRIRPYFPLAHGIEHVNDLRVISGPLLFFLTAGQASDYQGGRHLLDRMPKAKELLADRGYDADWFRNGLKDKGISPCIPPRKKRRNPANYDKVLYKQRYRIENMFGRIKDWRRIVTRYDRCAHTFLSAILIAATCCYWLD